MKFNPWQNINKTKALNVTPQANVKGRSVKTTEYESFPVSGLVRRAVHRPVRWPRFPCLQGINIKNTLAGGKLVFCLITGIVHLHVTVKDYR